MGKRILLILIFSILVRAGLMAQVTMVLEIPPTGVMQKAQLWNMALANSSGGLIMATIELTLIDSRTNQPVMTATTTGIQLPKGATQLNVKNIGVIQYNFLSPIFNVDSDPNGFLPIGDFRACYTVTAAGHGGEGLAQDCIPVQVQPLSPPQLTQPSDSAVLDIAYPQFTWLPPMPLNLFSDLSYDLLVTEVQPGQNPYEAIQQGIPVYTARGYRDPMNVYPSSDAPLDTGRTYAWRVVALNEGEFVAQSEVWTFRLATPKSTVVKPANGNYILLKQANEASSGVHVLTERIVGVKYYSFDKSYTATIRFLTSNGSVVKTLAKQLTYGDNFLGFTLDRSFSEGKTYQLELTDIQGNKYSTSFTIQSTTK